MHRVDMMAMHRPCMVSAQHQTNTANETSPAMVGQDIVLSLYKRRKHCSYFSGWLRPNAWLCNDAI